MKKKVLALLLCAVMTASLAACGDNDEQPSNQGNNQENQQQQENDQQQQEEVTPEALPDAFAHITFDEGANEGYTVVTESTDGSVPMQDGGVARAIVESSDVLGYADGPVGQAIYLDGKHGLNLHLEPTNTDTWTVSYWMNADRLGNFGATLQMGYNIGRAADAGNNVTWVNITQTDWGADGASIFPMLWSRNEASDAQDGTDCWPWMYAWDDTAHGKKEWVMITVVASGEQQTGPVSGATTCGAQLYINGALVYDSADNYENGTYFEYTWDATLAPNIMKPGSSEFESWFGINYWDIIYRGFVDDLWVFDTALTAGQVASLYALGDPNVNSVAPETVEVEPGITPDASAIAVLGNTDKELGWWSEWSDSVAIADGESKTVVLNNYSNGINNWCNYVVAFTNTETGNGVAPSADNYDGYAEYAVVRADLFGWGDEAYAGTFEGSWAEDPSDPETYDWATFASMMTDADVTLTISRSGSDVTIAATIVGADGVTYTSNSVITSTLTADAPCYFFITGEGAYIEVLSVE